MGPWWREIGGLPQWLAMVLLAVSTFKTVVTTDKTIINIFLVYCLFASSDNSGHNEY